MLVSGCFGLLGYIDPTGGLPPFAWGMFLAALLGALGALFTVLRVWGRTAGRWLWQRRRWLGVAGFLIGSSLMAFWFSRPPTPANGRKVILLGLDGLDPQLLGQYMAEGRLPHFSRLAKDGLYHPLATTTPPQSPVAWSSFWTATGPEEHGVFDFFKRDPKTYLPDLTISDRKRMRLPWAGKPFWEQGDGPPVHVVLQRAPLTFPPPRLHGRLLAGMGVWDARGTEGTYFFYSTRPVQDQDARGMIFPLRRDGGLFKADLPGPYYAGQGDTLREPFELEVAGDTATLRVQGRSTTMLPGRWSDWITVEFPQGILQLSKMKLLTRALWEERDGQTTLYIAPLNFDPAASPYAISSPKGYAAELAEAIGPYHTRGMPFDMQAVTDGVLSEEAFLEQCRLVSGESEAMLLHELGQFQEGLLFAYFEEPDVVQHLFWRGIDPEHPLAKLSETARYRNVIPECYERCDALLGRVRAAAGKGVTLVVLSDHGFAPFRTAVHLNAVLRDLGYLHLREGTTVSDQFFKDVDWKKTRAYAVGFNTVYLNLVGREGQGIVRPEEAPALKREIAAALERFTEPCPIRKVYLVEGCPTGPEMIVGYRRGFRASWETALGKVPAGTTEKNTKKWSGDHCIDSAEVPGIFLSSDPALDSESLTGVGPRVMQYLRGRKGTAQKK